MFRTRGLRVSRNFGGPLHATSHAPCHVPVPATSLSLPRPWPLQRPLVPVQRHKCCPGTIMVRVQRHKSCPRTILVPVPRHKSCPRAILVPVRRHKSCESTHRSIPHINQDKRSCPHNDRFHIQSVNLIDRSTLVYIYIYVCENTEQGLLGKVCVYF